MRKIAFQTVNKWAKLAEKPLEDKRLEQFQQDYFSNFRHNYYRFFYHMIAQTKPKIAVELGVDHGHTIVHMAAANKGTLVLGVDKKMQCTDPRHREYANCRIHYLLSKDTEDLIQDFVRKHGKIGVVFQDSSHHYNDSKIEWDIYSKCLDKNAIWVCDDITPDFHDPNFDPPDKGMIEYWNELPGQKKLYKSLHFGTVMGVILIP